MNEPKKSKIKSKSKSKNRATSLLLLLTLALALAPALNLPAPPVNFRIMDESGTNVLRTSVRFSSLTNPQQSSTNIFAQRDFVVANTNSPLLLNLHEGRWRVTVGPLFWTIAMPSTNAPSGIWEATELDDSGLNTFTYTNQLSLSVLAGSNAFVFGTNGVYVVSSTATGSGGSGETNVLDGVGTGLSLAAGKDGVTNLLKSIAVTGGGSISSNATTLTINVPSTNNLIAAAAGTGIGNTLSNLTTYSQTNLAGTNGVFTYYIPIGDAASGSSPFIHFQKITVQGTNSENVFVRSSNVKPNGTLFHSAYHGLQEFIEGNWDPAYPSTRKDIEFYWEFSKRYGTNSNVRFWGWELEHGQIDHHIVARRMTIGHEDALNMPAFDLFTYSDNDGNNASASLSIYGPISSKASSKYGGGSFTANGSSTSGGYLSAHSQYDTNSLTIYGDGNDVGYPNGEHVVAASLPILRFIGMQKTIFGTNVAVAGGMSASNLITTGIITNNGSVWRTGTGSPEGVVTAPIGSLYSRSDGSTDTAVYRKETGSGNTGWVAISAGGGGGGINTNGGTGLNNRWTNATYISASNIVIVLPTNPPSINGDTIVSGETSGNFAFLKFGFPSYAGTAGTAQTGDTADNFFGAGVIGPARLADTNGAANGSSLLFRSGTNYYGSPAGGGDMLSTANLSDVASVYTAAQNIKALTNNYTRAVTFGSNVTGKAFYMPSTPSGEVGIDQDAGGNKTLLQFDGSDGTGEIRSVVNNSTLLKVTGTGIVASVSYYGDLNGNSTTATTAGAGDSATAFFSSGTIEAARLGSGSGGSTKFLREDSTWQSIPGGGDALVANPLSQFAATTSAQLAGVISDETGSGQLVFNTSPSFNSASNFGNAFSSIGSVYSSEQFGQLAIAANNFALAVGYGAVAVGDSSVAVGVSASATGALAVAVGPLSRATNGNSAALGNGAHGDHENSSAIGYAAQTTSSNQVRLGISGSDISVPGSLSVAGSESHGGIVTNSGSLVVSGGYRVSATNTPVLDWNKPAITISTNRVFDLAENGNPVEGARVEITVTNQVLTNFAINLPRNMFSSAQNQWVSTLTAVAASRMKFQFDYIGGTNFVSGTEGPNAPPLSSLATNNAATLTNIYATNIVVSPTTILASSGNSTNYTVPLLPGPSGNLLQIYTANTNVYIRFTGTNIADAQRTIWLRGLTNTVTVTVGFDTGYVITNANFNAYLTNATAKFINFYNIDTTGTNVVVSDGGRSGRY